MFYQSTKPAFHSTKSAKNINYLSGESGIGYIRFMITRLKIFCFTLFIINGLQSCSTESEVHDQVVSSLSSKDYIAKEETSGQMASAEDLKMQFHGCKAHQ